VVVQTPGLIPSFPREAVVVTWGEDSSFSTPDPGVNCTLTLVIKNSAIYCAAPAWTASVERTSNAGDIVIILSGPEMRESLRPGAYSFQFVKAVPAQVEGDPSAYSFSPEGFFEVRETAGSFEVPEEVDS
jgi:hypothetical protein